MSLARPFSAARRAVDAPLEATEPKQPQGASWAALKLTDFAVAAASFGDEESAIRGANERIAQTLEADAAAIIDNRGIVAALGFGPGEIPHRTLYELVDTRGSELRVAGVGACHALVEPIDGAKREALVLARRGRDFSRDERDLAHGLAGVLGLTVRLLRSAEKERRLRKASELQHEENNRLLGSLKERKQLLERLSRIQGSIVRRRALDEVLEAIVAGAHELLGDETVGLRLVDPEDPQTLILVASAGISPELAMEEHRSRTGVGAGGLAAAEKRLVVLEDYSVRHRGLPAFAADGIRSAMAAPVRERGEVVGSLVVATHEDGRRYSQVEREMLVALAEHASLALTDAKLVNDTLEQALHDSLTGLPNRLLLRDRLDQALERSTRGGSVAALFVDLDAFKTVNDSLGHAAGDEVLVEAAKRILTCVRAGDTAARFGGDEFVVLLENVDGAQVADVAARVLDELERPFEVRDRELIIGASIGIAMSGADDDDLLRNADLALYRAKETGKGRSQVYEPKMHTAVVDRMELESGLTKALRTDELALHFQPIVELATGSLAGLEALVRWRHPQRGLLLPNDFVPIAEDGRLMVPLGRWVLHKACEEITRWGGPPTAALSVNVSTAQLHDTNLRDDVAAALDQCGLDPQRLVLELTETAFMTDIAAAGDRLTQLKELGIRIAIDDFGTGNASLQHLAQFPIDILKIDRSFVAQVGAQGTGEAIARSIIDLGENLDLIVVAEGIETADQQRSLTEMGCVFGQGFHLARPVRIDDLDADTANSGA